MAGIHHLVLLSSLSFIAFASDNRPNILFVVSDDHGWNNVGFRNPLMKTPYLDSLVSEGVLLSRHYVFKFCSPTRSSAMSGRLPIHVNQENSATEQPGAGVMLNFTMFPEKLFVNGYKTHQVGKWHCGQATNAHIPHGRGFDTSLGYFNWGEDHYDHKRGGQALPVSNPHPAVSPQANSPCPTAIDLWNTTQPARGFEGVYGGMIYSAEIQRILTSHDPTGPPFFVYLAWQNNHAPLQVPQPYVDRCSSSLADDKRTYCGMTNFMDEAMGNITKTLKSRNLWDNTLLVFTADNGGCLDAAGDNTPLKGGKFSDLEGGTRVLAFATGGLLPASVRNTTLTGFVHICDWSTTFMKLAGLSDAEVVDQRAKASGFPPIDGLDMWSMLSGRNLTSPRVEIALSANPPITSHPNFRGHYYSTPNQGLAAGYYVSGEGLIVGEWKLVTGVQHDSPFGNTSFIDCGTGCLFNIFDDPGETTDLAKIRPDKLQQLLTRQAEIRTSVFAKERGDLDQQACVANDAAGGFWTPWLPAPIGWPTYL